MRIRALLFIAIGVALLAGLFFVLRPPQLPPPETTVVAPAPATASASDAAQAAPAAVPAAAPAATTDTYAFRYADENITPADAIIRVNEGDTVIIELTSDSDEELHVHGYDLSRAVSAQQTTRLQFVAVHTGRFEIELHHADRLLATLEVAPR